MSDEKNSTVSPMIRSGSFSFLNALPFNALWMPYRDHRRASPKNCLVMFHRAKLRNWFSNLGKMDLCCSCRSRLSVTSYPPPILPYDEIAARLCNPFDTGSLKLCGTMREPYALPMRHQARVALLHVVPPPWEPRGRICVGVAGGSGAHTAVRTDAGRLRTCPQAGRSTPTTVSASRPSRRLVVSVTPAFAGLPTGGEFETSGGHPTRNLAVKQRRGVGYKAAIDLPRC